MVGDLGHNGRVTEASARWPNPAAVPLASAMRWRPDEQAHKLETQKIQKHRQSRRNRRRKQAQLAKGYPFATISKNDTARSRPPE